MTDTCPNCKRPKGGSLARGQCIITGGDACRLNTISMLRARVAELEASEAHYRGNYLDAVERLKESTRQLAPPINPDDERLVDELCANPPPLPATTVTDAEPDAS